MPLGHSRPQTSVLTQGAANRQAGGWQPCMLTWYDPALGGTNSASGAPDSHSATASGEPYNPNADTCAAPPAYPFGTMLTFRYGGSQVTCRVNDRGGAIVGQHFDLSRSAAQKLGIVNSGKVNAQFQVGAIAGGGSPPGNQPGGGGPGGISGGFDVLTAITDLLTMNFSDLAAQLAIGSVTVVKDIALGIGDWIVIPWWQWNQRAAQYYTYDELFSDDEKRWTVMPWTAAFWGIGYWLLFTDPEAKSLKPAPVRNSHIARHARWLQSLPARKQLIKPKNVLAKTPKKPKPVESSAPVTQTGTMRVTRHLPVQITGEHVNRESIRSETAISRSGTAPERPGRKTTPPRPPAPAPKPHAKDRTGVSSLPNSRGDSQGGTGQG